MDFSSREPAASGWDDIVNRYESEFSERKEENRTRWIFRGQRCAKYGLQSSLERSICLLREGVLDEAVAARRDILSRDPKVGSHEDCLIAEFQRRYHHYAPDGPDSADHMEWLSIMQHYGAPTRLLDWTYSFYVALFFAVEAGSGDCAVWALDRRWLVKAARRMLPALDEITPHDRHFSKLANFNTVFRSHHKLVYPLNPFRLNDRLTAQQGFFLVPGEVGVPFEDNLAAVMETADANEEPLRKITISNSSRTELLRCLFRMNISCATLFPGLEGYAKSLRSVMAFPEWSARAIWS